MMSSPHGEGREAKARNMVGGYSDVDAELLRSEEVLAMANFAVSERAARAEEFAADAFLAVTPAEVESGAVQMKVLEAQRQVSGCVWAIGNGRVGILAICCQTSVSFSWCDIFVHISDALCT